MTTDDVTHLRALLADATARAEKAEAERDAALAACAEMRAALECAAPHHQGGHSTVGRMIRDALSRPDLGRGWASPEVVAQMVGALQMVESDDEFDLLHEVTCKFVVDVLARLGKAGG